jgi:hypothetical protein
LSRLGVRGGREAANLKLAIRRSLLRQPGLDQGFAKPRRRVEKAWQVLVKPRHGEFGIEFDRLRQRGLRLRHLVRRRVKRRKGSVTQRLPIPRVDGFEAFLERRIGSTQRQELSARLHVPKSNE